jgi:formylglycine-generating enzyme required for sulfatase activity
MMGSPASEKDRKYNETQHEVTLSRGFWMLETPVTQGMWGNYQSNKCHGKIARGSFKN